MSTSVRGLDQIIREHPWFAGLAPEDLELLVGCAKNERFEAGQFLYRENQPADRFFVIRHGTVRLELFAEGRGPLPILTVREGDVLGSAWIVPPYRAGCDARALELVRAVSFDGPCMRGKCEADPRLGYELLRRSVVTLVERLMLTRLQLLDLYGGAADGRRTEGHRGRRER